MIDSDSDDDDDDDDAEVGDEAKVNCGPDDAFTELGERRGPPTGGPMEVVYEGLRVADKDKEEEEEEEEEEEDVEEEDVVGDEGFLSEGKRIEGGAWPPTALPSTGKASTDGLTASLSSALATPKAPSPPPCTRTKFARQNKPPPHQPQQKDRSRPRKGGITRTA